MIWAVRTATKATTRNGVPQGIGRPQHTSSQTDTVVRFVQGYVTVFLRLCDLGSKDRHLLLVMAFLRGLEDRNILLRKLILR